MPRDSQLQGTCSSSPTLRTWQPTDAKPWVAVDQLKSNKIMLPATHVNLHSKTCVIVCAPHTLAVLLCTIVSLMCSIHAATAHPCMLCCVCGTLNCFPTGSSNGQKALDGQSLLIMLAASKLRWHASSCNLLHPQLHVIHQQRVACSARPGLTSSPLTCRCA